MLLEAAASNGHAGDLELPLVTGSASLTEIDWRPLLPALLDRTTTQADRAELLHRTLANSILRIAQRLRSTGGPRRVGLTGGVFQNRRLCEQAFALLERADFEVVLPARVPCNDGGLAYGQVVEAAARLAPAR
jgi:hydrogenase maturation protein HypF